MTEADPSAPRATPAQGSHGRWVIVLVTCLFVLPILLAYALAFGWLPGLGVASVNRGVLLAADVSLGDQATLEAATQRRYGEWTVLLLAPADCAAPCGLNAASIARLQQALGIELERVQFIRILEELPARTEPGVQPLQLIGTPAEHWSARFHAEPVDVLLVDFEARPVLAYPRPALLADVLKDLRRLLRASKTH